MSDRRQGGQHGQVRAGLGVPSMVLVLVVLCLAMLGVLSMISARSDDALAARHIRLTQGYYEAAASAQTALAELDAQMVSAWQASADDAQYAEACAALTSVNDIPVNWSEQTAVLRFDAGFDRQLVVEIERAAWDDVANSRFSIVRHVLHDTLEWEQTDGLFLMGT